MLSSAAPPPTRNRVARVFQEDLQAEPSLQSTWGPARRLQDGFQQSLPRNIKVVCSRGAIYLAEFDERCIDDSAPVPITQLDKLGVFPVYRATPVPTAGAYGYQWLDCFSSHGFLEEDDMPTFTTARTTRAGRAFRYRLIRDRLVWDPVDIRSVPESHCNSGALCHFYDKLPVYSKSSVTVTGLYYFTQICLGKVHTGIRYQPGCYQALVSAFNPVLICQLEGHPVAVFLSGTSEHFVCVALDGLDLQWRAALPYPRHRIAYEIAARCTTTTGFAVAWARPCLLTRRYRVCIASVDLLHKRVQRSRFVGFIDNPTRNDGCRLQLHQLEGNYVLSWREAPEHLLIREFKLLLCNPVYGRPVPDPRLLPLFRTLVLAARAGVPSRSGIDRLSGPLMSWLLFKRLARVPCTEALQLKEGPTGNMTIEITRHPEPASKPQ